MATFLVLGLPTLLGTCFLVVFYVGLAHESARKRHQTHSAHEVFVAFKVDHGPSDATISPEISAVSTPDSLRVRRAHA